MTSISHITRIALCVLVATLGSSARLWGQVSTSTHDVIEPVAEESFASSSTDRGISYGAGALTIAGNDDIEIREFPLAHTDVDARIAGTAAHVRVTQTFQNPYETTIEAVYLFPLPHRAAVTDLEMRIGDRVIRGVVQRREEAQRTYETAKRAGKVASLLAQERPNIFRQAVANIVPGARIEITIEYVEELTTRRGVTEFAFPMVVGPRYIPFDMGAADVVPAHYSPAAEAARHDEDRRINPPFLPPAIRSGHDIDVTVEIDAGVPIRNLRSTTHAFEQTFLEPSRVRTQLHRLDRIPNKDFVLRWETYGEEPEVAVLTSHDKTDGYLSVLLHGRPDLVPTEITPKEMVFVLDCSGSMSGEPISAAKAVARHALRNLRADDSFRVVRFSDSVSGFHPIALDATPENVERAIAYLDGLRGSGGTQMIGGIRAALEAPPDGDRLRIVLFLTDGFIGNENQILAAIRDEVGRSRLFGFGVGNSVNRFLLDEMSREGRGEVYYHTLGSDVNESVATFYDRIRNPYLTDIEIEWNGVTVNDVCPSRAPDLFGGTPLELRARYAQGGKGELVVRGRIAGQAWQKRIPLDLPDRESGNEAVGTLWARSRVAELERSIRRARNEDTVEQIVELGLHHHLVTSYTSFVAVAESTVVSNGRPTTVRVPVPVAEGVSYEGAVGRSNVELPIAVPSGPGRASTSNTDYFVRGGRSGEVKTVVDGMPVSIGEMEVYEISGEPIKLLKREASSIRTIDTGEQTKIRAINTVQNPETDRLEVTLVVRSDVVALDGTIQLVFVFSNHGCNPVDVPVENELDLEHVKLRIATEDGRVTFVGKSAKVQTVPLAPGDSVIRRLALPTSALGVRTGDRRVSIRLERSPWGEPAPVWVTLRRP